MSEAGHQPSSDIEAKQLHFSGETFGRDERNRDMAMHILASGLQEHAAFDEKFERAPDNAAEPETDETTSKPSDQQPG